MITKNIMSNSHQHTMTDAHWVHWLLRFSIAATFFYHAFGKFGDLTGGAEQFGVPLPLWVLSIGVEILAPCLLLLGGILQNKRGGDVMTRLGGLFGATILIGAIALVHWGRWSFSPSETHPLGGMEFQVSLLAMHAYFILRGNNA